MAAGTPTGFEPMPNPSNSIESIREYIDARIADADRRYQQRYELTEKALDKSAAVNNTRLEAMNEFRSTLADQAARLPTRIEVENLVQTARAEAKADIGPLATKLDNIGRTNYPVMGAFAAVVFSIVSAGWVIIGLKIDATNQPLHLAVESERVDDLQLNDRLRAAEAAIVASSQADSISRSDRAQLNSRVQANEISIGTITTEQRTQNAVSTSKLTEVEGQFKAMSDVLNLTKDENQRLFSILYAKAFPGSILPPTNYRPQLYRGN